MAQVVQRLFSFARSEDASQSVERGAIPEILLACFGREAIGGPEFRREQGINGALRTVVDADGERNANPGAEMVRFIRVVAMSAQRARVHARHGFIKVTIGIKAFDVAA